MTLNLSHAPQPHAVALTKRAPVGKWASNKWWPPPNWYPYATRTIIQPPLPNGNQNARADRHRGRNESHTAPYLIPSTSPWQSTGSSPSRLNSATPRSLPSTNYILLFSIAWCDLSLTYTFIFTRIYGPLIRNSKTLTTHALYRQMNTTLIILHQTQGDTYHILPTPLHTTSLTSVIPPRP